MKSKLNNYRNKIFSALCLILLVFSLPIFTDFNSKFLSVIDHLRYGYIWIGLLFLMFSLKTRNYISVIFSFIGFSINIFIVVASFLPFFQVEGGSLQLKILHANIWLENPTLEAVADMLNREAPDIASIVELSDPGASVWQSRLDGRWPYRVDCAPAGCGNMILSRWPATALAARSGWHDGPDFPSVLAARIHHPQGDFTFVVAHLSRPMEPVRQREQARWLSQWLPQLPQPVIVAGDFNAAPWSGTMNIIYKASLRRIAHTGPTWPSGPLILTGIPIDHILGSPGVSASAVERLAPFGSDHLALKAEIALTPQPVATPAKPAGEGGGTPALVPTP